MRARGRKVSERASKDQGRGVEDRTCEDSVTPISRASNDLNSHISLGDLFLRSRLGRRVEVVRMGVRASSLDERKQERSQNRSERIDRFDKVRGLTSIHS